MTVLWGDRICFAADPTAPEPAVASGGFFPLWSIAAHVEMPNDVSSRRGVLT